MVAERLGSIRERIARAAAQAGRGADEITLLAVTKMHPLGAVNEAREAGLTIFGENRVQEASEKYSSIADSVELHLIGHLQRNKAKQVPGLFRWVESIDALRTAEALSRQVVDSGDEIQVLLQYNSSREASKSGYGDAEQLLDEAHAIDELPGLAVRGVMTIGPFVSDVDLIAQAFSSTYRLFTRLQTSFPGDGASIDTLSMGMTDDFEIAVREGTTEVRIGSAIFGAREAP